MTKEAGRHYQDSVRTIDRHFEGLLNNMKRSTAEWRKEQRDIMRKPIESTVKVILEQGETDEYSIGA